MSEALVLADDLTGALEAGALLAAHKPAVTLDHNDFQNFVTIIDTESRHLAPTQAREIHRLIAAQFPGSLYKKTDSTLRGNIGAEIAGLLDARPQSPLLYIPAYPKLGRTVRGGILYVEEIPVHLTAFGHDSRNPVTESHVPSLLARDCPYPVTVLDASTEADLEAIAAALPDDAIVASPAGFLRHWETRKLRKRTQAGPPALSISNCLVVRGSRHPRSLEQAAQPLPPGWRLIEPPTWRPGEEEQVAAELAAQVKLNLDPFDALLVFGGDTTRAVLQALDCRRIYPKGELLPGIPVSTIEVAGRTRTLITKAGGFGPLDLIAHLGSHK